MDLAPIRRQLVTPNQLSTATVKETYVQGPAEFIKQNLKLLAGRGASFQVHHFDFDPENLDPNILSQITSRSGATKSGWMIVKQIVPSSSQWFEAVSLDGVGADKLRLAPMVREMRILTYAPLRSHQNIISVFGFSWDKDSDELGRKWPVLIMENADCGSLSDFIRLIASGPTFTVDLTLSLAADMAAGLEALHGCDIVHGDLKPDNILIFELKDGGICAKLSDFGSAVIAADAKSSPPRAVTLLGYSPPMGSSRGT
jgi:hypothetical protein